VRASHTRANSVFQSFYFAFRGVVTGFADERNFRVQCLYGCFVGVLLLWFRPPILSCALAMASVLFLLGAELANSALERVVDLVSPQQSAPAGEAKDMAAAGVMLVSFASAGVVLAVLSSEMRGDTLIGVGGLLLWFVMANKFHRKGVVES
jgi:diacylglycerol kinase